MRQFSILSIILIATILVSGVVTAQVPAASSYGNDYQGTPGTYVGPFVPVMQTPIVHLAAPPAQIGASNATAGNVAGASNSTLSMNGGNVMQSSTVAEWYGPGAQIQPLENTNEPGNQLSGGQVGTTQGSSRRFQFGAATFQDSVGLARLIGNSAHRELPKRTFTNEDLTQVDSKTQKAGH
ncbi:MAG: hypothetical protein JOY93_01335 [Acidobacteriales bacterium]|nr:hypothetical protein [Terriglobales bacterium]